MAACWQLLIDSPQSGAANMRIDELLLQEVESSTLPLSIIRFYRWDAPTLSLGRNQHIDKAVNQDLCKARGIAIVHRPTGGRAVLHADELTYSIASNDRRFFRIDNVLQNYLAVSRGLQIGFKQLGIVSELAGDRRPEAGVKGPRPQACFTSACPYELLSANRKLVGSAQKRLKRSFLQHGSIPLRINYTAMAEALSADEQVLKTAVISVSESAGREISFEELQTALQSSLKSHFGIRWGVR
ncbi:MAG: lipoate--protein ligase family protein [Acidobacteriota bacterium]